MNTWDETSPPTKPTVLLVFGEYSIRAMWGQILDLEGYEILTATDGSEGLAVMRLCAQKEESLVVVSDINMWGMHGDRMLMIAERDGLLRRHAALVVSHWVPLLAPDDPFVRLCRRARIELIAQPCTADEFIHGVERAAERLFNRAGRVMRP